ncbi:MAG: hypothetical protein AAB416_03995 [Patescibacteria group bacterium]
MPETRKKPKESFEALLRRFNKQVLQSGRLIQVRKIRFHKKTKNQRKLRETALRRMTIESKKEYLKKIGKLGDRFPGTKALMKL